MTQESRVRVFRVTMEKELGGISVRTKITGFGLVSVDAMVRHEA